MLHVDPEIQFNVLNMDDPYHEKFECAQENLAQTANSSIVALFNGKSRKKLLLIFVLFLKKKKSENSNDNMLRKTWRKKQHRE